MSQIIRPLQISQIVKANFNPNMFNPSIHYLTNFEISAMKQYIKAQALRGNRTFFLPDCLSTDLVSSTQSHQLKPILQWLRSKKTKYRLTTQVIHQPLSIKVENGPSLPLSFPVSHSTNIILTFIRKSII